MIYAIYLDPKATKDTAKSDGKKNYELGVEQFCYWIVALAYKCKYYKWNGEMALAEDGIEVSGYSSAKNTSNQRK